MTQPTLIAMHLPGSNNQPSPASIDEHPANQASALNQPPSINQTNALNKTSALKYLTGTLLISLILNGCASTPEYLAPPSKNKSPSDYKREQLSYPAGQELGGAAVSGLIGGLLGPIGIIATVVGTTSTRRHAQNVYWQSLNNTELVGLVIQDATKKRNQEFIDHPRWFANLPAKPLLPAELNVDLGAGNSLVVPVAAGIQPKVGDIVTIIAPPTTDHLMNVHADFYKDMPKITAIRCKKQDTACISKPENELGVARHLNATAGAETNH